MPDKKKSVLDSFMKSPGASSLKKAADLLSQTSDQPSDQPSDKPCDTTNTQPNNRTIDHRDQEKNSYKNSTTNHQGHLTRQMTEQMATQITTDKDKEQMYFLNENEALLYAALRKNVDCFTTVKRIAKKINRSEHTIRKCLKRLARMGLVGYQRDNLRTQQGIRIVEVREVKVRVLGDKSKVDRMIKKAHIEEIAFDKK